MKLSKFSKRLFCLLLVCATLLLACACSSTENSLGSDSDSDSANGGSAAPSGVDAGAEIVLSGENAFRVVYSAAYKSQALQISKKLINLDKSYVQGSNKYATALDRTTPADGTPEIIIGAANREASNEAKKLIEGKKNHFAIYVTASAIAIYSTSKAGVEAGIDAFLKKLSAKDGAVIYNNSKGNVVSEFTPPEVEAPDVQVAPIAETRPAAKSSVDADTLLNALKRAAGSKAYSIAVSTTEELKAVAIRNTDPQNTYSVSKVFCVTAIGMLYDEGKIEVSETIGDIFRTELNAYGITDGRWDNITVHDVMKHEVGFKQGGLLDIDADPGLLDRHDDFLKVTLSYELTGSKGYKYTDAAYYLISRVVAKKSGQKLDAYLKSRLFDKADYKNYTIVTCPQGHPIGATQFFLRPEDVVKLGRIYLDGGTYNGERIISQDWVNQVIKNGYELKSSNNGYGKGGMRGQYIYVNFKHNVAVAWLSETDGGTSGLSSKLKSYMT